MRVMALTFVMACCLGSFHGAWAAPIQDSAEYGVTVHVTCSKTEILCSTGPGAGCGNTLKLAATLDGHAYELQGYIKSDHLPMAHNCDSSGGYLALGDYKAKLLPANPKDPNVAYFIIRRYEVLFPDGRLGEFRVIGEP